MHKHLLLSMAAACLLAGNAKAATLVVTTTADDLTPNDGGVSLREAISAINAGNDLGDPDIAAQNPGTFGSNDRINFNIPGSGVRTISTTSVLPQINKTMTIDGYSQPGSSVNTLAVGNNAVLLVELDGTSGSGSAFLVNSANNTFKGLVINRFPGASGDGGYAFRFLSAGNTVQGCYLGTNAAGDTAAINRGGGVSVEATSQPPATASGSNLIGGATAAARNVILGGNGFAIDINGLNAAVFQGGIIGGDGNTVQGNYLGTNAAGSAMLGRPGIQILTKNNLIGGTTTEARNAMFSNGGFGVSLRESNATGNVIEGNFIGIDATGSVSLGGNTVGINLLRAPNNLIGGTAAGAGNVISGNGSGAINADDSENLTIQGNLIGTDAAGTAAVPNLGGITISTGINTRIGGTTPAARNVISGNTGPGVRFALFTASAGILIQGNYIGTDVTGTAALGNTADGIALGNPTFGGGATPPTTPSAVIIGGTTAGARNIISNNGANGIALSTENLVVQGNYIGTDVNGTADLGNAALGVRIEGNNDTIGGTAPGAGNIIAFSGKAHRGNTAVQSDSGIVSYGTGNAILGNSIFSNLRLGIDLPTNSDNAFGVTANDPGDADTGGNNLQNFPVITATATEGSNVRITGTLNSAANTTYRIEFFANETINASGFGEGKYFVGFVNVTTDSAGDASFDATFPAVLNARRITATATDPAGNTSEFSAALGQLLNISTRLQVQTGDNILIAGFIVTGTADKTVLVRALGPSLAALGVSDSLQDPTLELHDSNGDLLAANDDWQDSQKDAVVATGIPPTNDRESAIVRTLPAGSAGYTAIVRGKNDTVGTAVVEVYDLAQPAASELANISTRGLVQGGNNVLIGGFIAGNGVTRVLVRALGPSLADSGVTQPLANPTLELRDPNGALVAQNDDWRTTQEAEINATQVPPTRDAEAAIVATLSPGGYTAVVRSADATMGVGLVEVYALR